MPENVVPLSLLYAGLFSLGLVVGSFLNVVIYRLRSRTRISIWPPPTPTALYARQQ
jgi:prepilin signal peptidase PulO-like enzyme (type II secretory pathway)